jgi:hypothetical protein
MVRNFAAELTKCGSLGLCGANTCSMPHLVSCSDLAQDVTVKRCEPGYHPAKSQRALNARDIPEAVKLARG